MKSISKLLLCAALLSAGPLPAADSDDDVYKEDAISPYLDTLPDEVSEPEEQKLVIPPYPRQQDLIEVDVRRYGYPYRVFVDAASLSVGKDRIVRYTAVLRSPSGVDNVSFEGIRCPRHQFKRYAYGSGGRFYPRSNVEWERIHKTRQNIYRNVLANEYFCPLPGRDQAQQILGKLRRSASTRDSFPVDQE